MSFAPMERSPNPHATWIRRCSATLPWIGPQYTPRWGRASFRTFIARLSGKRGGGRPVAVVVPIRPEAVALARDRLDVLRLPPVVVELHAKLADVAVHDVALDLEIGAPDRCEKGLSRKDLARVGGEDVQEGLLDGGELQRPTIRELHGLGDEVDLELLAERDARIQGTTHTAAST